MVLMPLLLTVVGMYFLVCLRGFFVLHPVRTVRRIMGAFQKGEGKGLSAFALALAGTLGVGNLSGIALGLLVGGAGSLFWMLMASVFACVLKYAEVLICKDVCAQDGVGMMQVIRRCLPRGQWLSIVYAIVCLLTALSMGAMLQSRAVCACAEGALGWQPGGCALLLAVPVGLVIIGGVRGIERTVSVVIPVAAGVYMLLSVGVLVVGRAYIPEALRAVWQGAFESRGVTGGLLGIVTSQAVKRGFAGGLLSNEAGAGTSALSHVRGGRVTAAEQGLIGIAEVLCDTWLCALTGLSLLVGCGGVLPPQGTREPMRWLMDVFSASLGPGCRVVLLLLVLAFAFSTIICWYYYGMRCIGYVWHGRVRGRFALVYLACVCVGGVAASPVTVRVVDACLAVLTALTLSALVASRARICMLHWEQNGKKQRKRPTNEVARR